VRDFRAGSAASAGEVLAELKKTTAVVALEGEALWDAAWGVLQT